MSVLCLQGQVAKYANGLFYCSSLLPNNNMATNLLMFTSSYDIRRFVACPCWTQTSWQVMQREWLLIAVSTDAGQRRHCPPNLQKRDDPVVPLLLLFSRSKLLLNSSKHSWKRFFWFSQVFIAPTFYCPPLPYRCSSVPGYTPRLDQTKSQM